VYIGDAIFSEGARPDVEAVYATFPFAYRAGWGYMLLTNFLPNGGNGVFQISAYAYDREGHAVKLGTNTITCDNAHATKPFGTIDFPGQGGVISGSSYRNHGWVLTPQPCGMPLDGSTMVVYIDGVGLGGHPLYNLNRPDVQALFPGLVNTAGAGGYYDFSTLGYANGVHTIAWGVVDSCGRPEGIGSRYFTVLNGASPAPAGVSAELGMGSGEVVGVPIHQGAIRVRRGYGGGDGEIITASRAGRWEVRGREVERVEVELGGGGWRGYEVVGGRLRGLPIGSALDGSTGVFTWQPGVGYVGRYELVFVRGEGARPEERVPITIVLAPKQFEQTPANDGRPRLRQNE
jgi:hypothetical protein